MNFITKDSGKRQTFPGGFQRDIDEGKLRFDLIPTNMLRRLAGLYTRGIQKYGENNRQQAMGSKAIRRFQQCAYRHFIQWMEGDYEEDHAVAVAWNVFAYEWHKDRLEKQYLTFENGLEQEDSILDAFTKEE